MTAGSQARAGELLDRDDSEAFAKMLARAQGGRNPFLQFPERADVAREFAALEGMSPDEWCDALSRRAEHHARIARDAVDRDDRRDAWLSAYCFWQLARYPVADTAGKRAAYESARDAFDRYCEDDAIETARIAIATHAGREIPALLRTPPGRHPRTLVALIGGLDMWKEEAALTFGSTHVAAGRAVLAVDAPGTGESPYPMAPEADEGWQAIVRWATRETDYERVVVHGVSMGGYWAARITHLWPHELAAVVVHGGPGAATFSRSWLEQWTAGDYPVGFLRALIHTTRAESFDDLVERLGRLSLDELAAGPCSPTLLVNGVEDRTALFEDTMWLLTRGRPKSARFFPGGHMGMTPETLPTISSWIDSTIDCAQGGQ
jgi:pimeloyl-ACP methyl ester carboxylesterase